MAAALDDAPVIQHHDGVGIADRGQAVRDDEHRAPPHERIHALLHDALRAGVDGGGGLVQNHHGRVGHGRARDGDQLSLALAQSAAVAGEHGLVAVGQHADEGVGIDELGGTDAVLVRGVELSVAQVFHHRTGKEVDILQNHAQRAAQVALADFVDIDAVIADLAVGDVVEAVEQVGDGGFARARRAHEGDLLTRLRVEGDVVQNGLVRHIAEIHVIQHDIALELGVGHGAVMMRMLPGPQPGAGLAFHELAVLPARIDQRHIAVVVLAGFIHQVEDAFRARQGHDNRAELLADLAQRHHEAA